MVLLLPSSAVPVVSGVAMLLIGTLTGLVPVHVAPAGMTGDELCSVGAVRADWRPGGRSARTPIAPISLQHWNVPSLLLDRRH